MLCVYVCYVYVRPREWTRSIRTEEEKNLDRLAPANPNQRRAVRTNGNTTLEREQRTSTLTHAH